MSPIHWPLFLLAVVWSSGHLVAILIAATRSALEVREVESNGTRRGPGWWMDGDGTWNPPEQWPESTPPLPGWVRSADGLWQAEASVEVGEDAITIIDLTNSDPTSGRSVRTPKNLTPPEQTLSEAAAAKPPSLRLGFSDEKIILSPAHAAEEEPAREIRWSLVAAIVALIAGLVVVLLVL